jgi:molecular chaperone GrpE
MDELSKKGNGETGSKEKGEESAKPQIEKESPASEVEVLRQELELRAREAKENYDRFLRQAAELENFKKRAARDKAEAIQYANESLVRDLLPVLDNLERAVEHAKGGGNGKPLVEGVEMVFKGFLDVLNKHGVTQISALGEKFNPDKHEAVAQVESEDHEPNTVVAEHHKGYYLLDRLLRPSLVSVAKPAETKEKKGEDEKVEKEPNDD